MLRPATRSDTVAGDFIRVREASFYRRGAANIATSLGVQLLDEISESVNVSMDT